MKRKKSVYVQYGNRFSSQIFLIWGWLNPQMGIPQIWRAYCTCWWLMYLLWRNVCSRPLPILKLNLCLIWSSFKIFGINPLLGNGLQYLYSPVLQVAFHSVDCFLWRAVLKFGLVAFDCFCPCCRAFGVILKKPLTNPVSWSFFHVFF